MNELNLKEIERLYWKEELPIKELAMRLNCSNGTIYNRMVAHDIPRRSFSAPFKGKHHSKDSRRKISLSQMGRSVSLETRRKISESMKGRTLSEDHRRKLSESHKGQIPWDKGLTKETDERLRKHSQKLMGRKLSEETKRKMSEGHRGMKFSEEHKRKISMALMGNKYGVGNQSLKGRHLSEEHKKRISLAGIGEKHWNWQGGKSFEPYLPEFNEFLKRKIREHDGHQCQVCGISESDLENSLSVHHIDEDKTNNDPENLISLCRSCHIKIHNGGLSL